MSKERKPARSHLLGFVLNPTSGAGRGIEQWRRKLRPMLETEHGAEGEAWIMEETRKRGDATQIAMRMIREHGVDVLVSVGGDGTHNEVVNGYMLAHGKELGVDLGIISSGTGGDLKRTLYDSVEDCGVRKQLQIILQGSVCLADAGLVMSTPHALAMGGLEGTSEVQTPPHSAPAVASRSTNAYEEPAVGFLDGGGGEHTNEAAPVGSTSAADSERSAVTESDDEEAPSLAASRAGPASSPRSAATGAGNVDAAGDPGEGNANASVVEAGMTMRRYFLNISSCGVGGTVCHEVNTSTKALGGFISFFYQTCKQTLLWRNKPIRVWLDHSDESFTMNVYQLVMAIGQYHGGGVFVAPNATMCSGKFVVVKFRDIGVVDVSVLARVYFGSHTEHSKVEETLASHVRAESLEDDVLIEIDGEEGGKLPAEWHLIHQGVRLIVPEGFGRLPHASVDGDGAGE